MSDPQTDDLIHDWNTPYSEFDFEVMLDDETMRDGLRLLVQEIPGVKSVVDSMEDMPLIVRAMG